jgi:hypothetical protein
MNGNAHQLRRIAAALVLAVSVSMLAAQAATAFDGRSPDTQAAVTLHTGDGLAVDVRSPDTRAAAQPTSGTSSTAGQSISVAGSSSPAIDMSSADTRDAIASAGGSTRTVTVWSERFDWADFGLGAGVAAGSLLLLAALAAAAMSGRRRNRPSTV